MKPNIHPSYAETEVKCACGNVIKTRCTVPDMHVEICSACHPFYTKSNKLVTTTGRIEKFNKKYNLKQKD
ncbi:MAG: 50S ribosomal protein L31 [Spirochaetota bacterium]